MEGDRLGLICSGEIGDSVVVQVVDVLCVGVQSYVACQVRQGLVRHWPLCL